MLWVSYFLNLFDLLMTYRWYTLYGLSVEANPIGRWLIATNLAIPVKVFGIGACLIALYVCIKRQPKYRWVAWVVLAVYGVLGVYHVIIAGIIR